MARPPALSWKAHYEGKGKVDTVIKSDTTCFDLGGKRTPKSLKVGHPVVVHVEDVYQPKLLCDVDGVMYRIPFGDIQKPIAGKNTSLYTTIDARAFCVGGRSVKVEYNNEAVPAMEFIRVDQLEKSILKGIMSYPFLGEPIHDIFEQFFDNGVLNWGTTPVDLVDKLGNYIGGEMLLAWSAMKGGMVRVAFPTDPSFSTVDLWVFDRAGTMFSLSAKYDKGAAASLFTGVVEKAIKNWSPSSRTEFSKFVGYLKKKNIPPSKAKDCVWNYGVHEILKLTKVPSPVAVQESIRRGKPDAHTATVIQSIQSYTSDRKILSELPGSASTFFCREIANRFRSDGSMDEIREILVGKAYDQYHVNKTKWRQGVLEFDKKASTNASVELETEKSKVSDIARDKGWINYRLS